MMRKTFWTGSLLLLLLPLPACNTSRTEPPPPEWLIGAYHYSGSGSIARKFPWKADATLVLERDGQYTLAVSVFISDEDGGDTDTDESYGTYSVSGNRLLLDPIGQDGGPEEYRIHGNNLVPRLPWPTKIALKGFRIPDPVFVKTE